MAVPKRSAVKATLRQLAVQGLPGVMLHGTLAKVMARLVPCEMVAFQHLDNAGGLAEAWINFPELLPELGIYLEHFHNSREAEAHATFDEFFRSAAAVDMLHRGVGDYLASALYNELYRGIDFRYVMRTAFRDGGVARGCVLMSRGHGARDYTGEEMRLMTDVAPYLTHAFSAPAMPAADARMIEVDEGQLVCKACGSVEFVSPRGRALLHDLAETPMIAATLSNPCLAWATPQLRRLIEEAARLAAGKPAQVPVIERRNARGKYVLRVWQLAAMAGDGTPGLYSVSIRRYVPLALRLLECQAVVALPGREKQIALLLAEGRENREIADRLGLTVNTVISNIRSLYGRLGIGGRGELVARLLDGGS